MSSTTPANRPHPQADQAKYDRLEAVRRLLELARAKNLKLVTADKLSAPARPKTTSSK